MSRGESSIVHRQVHVLFNTGALGGLTDGQLLECVTARRGVVAESAFAALVERHGPMVLGVCRRILQDPHDASDAFQATFLVLVRKANAVRVSDSLGRWLYGVSRRVALQARAASARRSALEVSEVDQATAPAPAPDPEREERLSALDEEIARLPEKYRMAVVLCELAGMNHDEAARQLGCPVGTVESRLFRGRGLLRDRLIRRGLAPATVGLVLSAGRASASAAVPAELVDATARTLFRLSTVETISGSIAHLAKGVMRAMFLNRLKVAALVLLSAGLVGTGARFLAGQEHKDGNPAVADRPNQATQAPREKSEDAVKIADLERRVRYLERKLDAVLGDRRVEKAEVPPPRVDPETLRKVRPRFECLVEKIHVKAGQKVKKGDPLADLFSDDLVATKNLYLEKTNQWNQDQMLLKAAELLYHKGVIGQENMTKDVNIEKKSRLDMTFARDRLLLYGLSTDGIEAIKDEEGERKARMTLRSPVDGTVLKVEAAPQDLSDPKSVLMTITTANP